MEIIDTNVIVRFLVGDNQKQKTQASLWFKEAEQGKRKIIVKALVIAEVCFILESFYKKERDEIASAMEIFLSQRWLQVEDREALLGLWPLYKKKMHFVDSYLLVSASSVKAGLLSFDAELNKHWTKTIKTK